MKHLAIDSVQRPSLALLGAEPFRAAIEFAWHKLEKSDDAKPGDGHPVVVFPGLGADRKSVAALRAHCRALGYAAFDWGHGFNTGPKGDLDVWLHTLKSQVADLLAGHTQPATLIGWSLGGLYAREIGKLMAPRIRQVITMGTPFNAKAHHTNVGWLFRLVSGTSSAIDPALSQGLRTSTNAHHLDLQPVGWCCGVANLSPRQSIEPRTRHRSRRQPCRHGLEPGGACGGRRPARSATRAMVPV